MDYCELLQRTLLIPGCRIEEKIKSLRALSSFFSRSVQFGKFHSSAIPTYPSALQSKLPKMLPRPAILQHSAASMFRSQPQLSHMARARNSLLPHSRTFTASSRCNSSGGSSSLKDGVSFPFFFLIPSCVVYISVFFDFNTF